MTNVLVVQDEENLVELVRGYASSQTRTVYVETVRGVGYRFGAREAAAAT